MYLYSKSNYVLLLTAAVALAAGDVRRACADPATEAQLTAQVQKLSTRVEELEKKEDQNWLTQERTQQIRAIVEEAIADAKKHDPAAPTVGYNNGFYIQSPDANFKLAVGAIIQLRYTFARDRLMHKSAFATKPASGDVNGFDVRRTRLIFSGNAFTPNLTYNVSGDFGGDFAEKSDQGFLQLQDAYVAYHVNDWLNFRGGSFVVPFSRAEYTFAGLEFVDFPTELAPFDPVRSLGFSVLGQPIKDRFSYEVNMNNGQKGNNLGRDSEINTNGSSPFTGSTDNRMAFYSRVQYAGAGKLSDFLDEPDLRKDNGSLAWAVGAAVGYESANTSKNAFPNPQGNATIVGLSTQPSPGFAGAYAMNGDLYRATVDWAAKYHGCSVLGAAYFQQMNQNPGLGVTSSIPTTSFFETGFYSQAGYMLTKNWEVVARAGELLTEGGPNRMETYGLGVNYYMYGQNVKVQSDVTYIPNEAAYTSSCYDTAINTQDLIFRMQLQLKF